MKDKANEILEILEGAKDDTGCIPMTLVRQALKKLEQRWIMCSEKLPEEMTRVLTTIKMPRKEPKVRSGIYSHGLFMNDNGDVWRPTDKEVKAWQYLPEPYRKEK